MRILIFGDSIGNGFYDEVNGGWAQLLQREYFAKSLGGGEDTSIMNLSVGGCSSQEALERIDAEASARKNSEVMMTILAIGVNDSREVDGLRWTDESLFKENITRIVNTAKKYGRVLVLGCTSCVDERVQPTIWDKSLHYSNQRLKEYGLICGEVSVSTDVDFLPLWQLTYDAQQNEETMPDGIHPNTRGHAVIYEAVSRKLQGMI